MADNVQANTTTTSGAVFATDEIGGVHHSRVKLQTGADGSATDVSATNPVPVRLNDGSANLDVATLDLDSGGGTVTRVAMGLALPGAGGPVAGGTATNPVRVDPTGTTPQLVKGTDAHGAAIAGDPILMGVRARNEQSGTAVADDEVTYVWADNYGRLVVAENTPPQVAVTNGHGPTAATLTASGDTTVITAPASESIYVTAITAVNSDGSNDVLLRFKDGGNTRVHTFLLKLAVNNYSISFSPPWKMTAATALVANLSATGNVYATVHYYVAT
jgi:hypothetical protein